MAAFRPSSRRQAGVAWRTFQKWLPASTPSISRATVLEFLEDLFEGRTVAPGTIVGYRNSLKRPLSLAFGVDFEHEDFALQAKAHFIERPPKSKSFPQWSLDEALMALSLKTPVDQATDKDLFLRTLFLVALAAGNRASELAAIDRRAVAFAPDGSSASLPVVQGFLYKNQSAKRRPPKIVIPNLPEPDDSLCPVKALRRYLTLSQGTGRKLFRNPASNADLNAGTLAFWLCKAITWLVPNATGRAHDVRKAAHSLAWVRGIPAEEIVNNGFWASPDVFLRRYLDPTTSASLSCVAGGHRLVVPRPPPSG